MLHYPFIYKINIKKVLTKSHLVISKCKPRSTVSLSSLLSGHLIDISNSFDPKGVLAHWV